MSFGKWFEERFTRRDDNRPQNVGAIIAIGIDVDKKGLGPSPQSAVVAVGAERIFSELKNDNSGLILILTGGYHHKDRPGFTEAFVMQERIRNSVPKEAIILEEKSWRTYLNADNVLPILQELHLKQVIIVAQQWHARRVAATFKKRWAYTGIEFAVVKAWSEYGGGSQRRLNNFFYFFVWDTLAFIISKLKGYC